MSESAFWRTYSQENHGLRGVGARPPDQDARLTREGMA